MRTLSFFAGLLFGVFALLIAQNLGFLRFVRQRPAPAVEVGAEARPDAASLTPEERAAQDELVARFAREIGDPQGKNLDPLAIALEEAFFEKSWTKVQAIAALIRARGAEWVTPPVAAPSASGPEEKSLFDQERDIIRKRRETRLGHHLTAATALAGKTDARTIAQLREIFETARSDAERVDAAWMLARSGDEAALRMLLEALRSPDAERRAAAGEALAREGSLAAAREAAAIIHSEPDIGLRQSAVACVAEYEAALRGEPQHPATQAVIEALRKDAEARVRRVAAEGLHDADLQNGRVLFDAVLDAIQNDLSPAVRLEAMTALAAASFRDGPPGGAVDAVGNDLRLEKDPRVQAKMIAFLGTYGEASALRTLDELAAAVAGTENAGLVEDVRRKLTLRLARESGR